MTRILIESLSPFVLALALTLATFTSGCEAPSDDTDLDADELLDIDIEQQLENRTQAELVCSAWPEAEDFLAEYAIAPCIEWTVLTDKLTLDSTSTEEQIPTAGCSQWQEHYFADTNVSCGGWGGGQCSGNNCCTLSIKYVRTCSACPPSVPTSCGAWTYAGTICTCG
jgi:hypothetical protein